MKWLIVAFLGSALALAGCSSASTAYVTNAPSAKGPANTEIASLQSQIADLSSQLQQTKDQLQATQTKLEATQQVLEYEPILSLDEINAAVNTVRAWFDAMNSGDWSKAGSYWEGPFPYADKPTNVTITKMFIATPFSLHELHLLVYTKVQSGTSSDMRQVLEIPTFYLTREDVSSPWKIQKIHSGGLPDLPFPWSDPTKYTPGSNP